jgi:hypothetical protein
MDTNYCVNLNLNNLAPLRDDINWRDYTRTYQKIIPIEDINPKVIELLNEVGLGINWTECFYTDPTLHTYDFDKLHIDSPGGGDYIKLNWIYGGKESKMIWGKPIGGIEKPLQISAAGTKYREYSTAELDIVHSQEVGFPSIVQVGIPHTVYNYIEPRLCVCIMPGKIGRDITMAEAIEVFKNYRINGQ